MKLREVALLTGGKLHGDPDTEITGASGIHNAVEGDITFVSGGKFAGEINKTKASAVILREEHKSLSRNSLVVANPQYAFAVAADAIYAKPYKSLGISKEAVIGKDVNFGEDVSIHPLSFIGGGSSIGSRTVVCPGAYIGEGVTIGDDCAIYPNVSVYGEVKIGNRVIIHSGTVIGSDGFGFVKEKGKLHKIPQLGGVIIEDDVEIGSNASVDRATMKRSFTIIGRGTKIDNLVQIAHNVVIGKNCLIVSQTGIAGSSEIGDDVILAGQAGIPDHVRIGRNAVVTAKSGVAHDIPEGGVFSGTPAIPHRTWLRAQNIISKLPEYIKRLQALERKANKEVP
ncbi:MAG: UDP-3-O-(3-hydroxymyristoyl)glucosamine N-acyltransferase [Nitrospirae bacterium]|nr:UDP-3-O-(3-hydroxymyristoyl)glucosamine N-acyltransferase [Nitrospirota bacterium]